MKNYKKLAVTGGIGSGKSLATEALKEAGYFTISSDAIVTDLYEKVEVRKLLKSIFPTAIGDAPDYSIDRKAVAKIAFSNKLKHEELTRTITPLVMEEIEKRAKNNEGVTVVEVPLLFECGYEKYFDGVIVITREKEERIKSVITRSNLSREEVIKRMENQVDYDSIDLSPFSVIKNDCDKELFISKVLLTVKNLI
jgi:dephospho-CoA kinase